jgi:GMP synthase (glutamine-hydrolysing)
MNYLIVNCGSKKTPEIAKKVNMLGAHTDIINLHETIPLNFNTYTGIIMSGAPILLTETHPDNLINQIKPLIFSKIPLLGICFGHQLLGLAYGAQIKRCSEDRSEQEIEIFNHQDLFSGFNQTALFNEDHCECISLPKEFILLASSKICRNEAMKHAYLPFFGVQFHPETSGENGTALFKNFMNICERQYMQ